MQKELENASAVAVEVPLEPTDGVITLVPERFVVLCARYALGGQNFRMHAYDQYFLIIRAVVDSDLAALRQGQGGPPEKVVLELGRARMLETVHVAALRVHARHHVRNHAVL